MSGVVVHPNQRVLLDSANGFPGFGSLLLGHHVLFFLALGDRTKVIVKIVGEERSCVWWCCFFGVNAASHQGLVSQLSAIDASLPLDG